MVWSRRRVAVPGMVLGSLPCLVATMLPRPPQDAAVYLVPLSDLAVLSQRPVGFVVVQLVGNLLLLAPLGFFLPVRFAVLASVPRVLALAAAVSLGIEVVQWVWVPGRTFSVDDIVLNAVGAGAAAALSRRWWQPKPRDPARPGPRRPGP